jgi:hypothetical protein
VCQVARHDPHVARSGHSLRPSAQATTPGIHLARISKSKRSRQDQRFKLGELRDIGILHAIASISLLDHHTQRPSNGPYDSPAPSPPHRSGSCQRSSAPPPARYPPSNLTFPRCPRLAAYDPDFLLTSGVRSGRGFRWMKVVGGCGARIFSKIHYGKERGEGSNHVRHCWICNRFEGSFLLAMR